MKVLVLGDGLLGGEIIKQTNWNYFSRKKNNFDISNLDLLPIGYDIIVNCIAHTKTYSDEKELHWDINYRFVSDLIDYCNNKNIKLVHISTDYVYSDSDSLANEENTIPIHSKNWYSYTKLLSDGLVQLKSNDFLLCRCTQVKKPFPYEKAFINRIGNFDYVDKIANIIIKMINKKLSGLYNVGTEVKTMYELAKVTKKNVIKDITPNYAPLNLTMDTTKLNNSLKTPFFSIPIPTYGYNGNGVEFLEFSLDIIYKQTFKDYEVILSDHSIDDTIKNVYEKWKDKINITYVVNENGRGIISPNINNAMKLCNGKWIKILFQDDFLYNEHSLENQYNFIKNNVNMFWFMTKFYHSNDGKSFYNLYTPKWNDDIWTGHNTMGCPSGMTLKNEKLIFFNEELNWLMDVEYYKRMYDIYGEPYYLDEITYVNRTWGERLTDTINQELKNKEFNILKNKYA